MGQNLEVRFVFLNIRTPPHPKILFGEKESIQGNKNPVVYKGMEVGKGKAEGILFRPAHRYGNLKDKLGPD